MASWSQRRKLTYGSIIFLFVVLVIVVPVFSLIYKAPTCSDGSKNGNEQGIDCGGSCERLCSNSFISPTVAWARFEQVAPGLFNVAAYIVNPNTEGEASRVPYRMSLYDNQGILITEHPGVVTIPPHRNTMAFVGSVNVGKRTPAKALFEFMAVPDWRKRSDPLSHLVIDGKDYTEEDTSSLLSIVLRNNGIQTITRLAVYVIVYDRNKNAIGFSKTLVDTVPPQGTASAEFTWPFSRRGKVVSIEVLPVAE